MLRAHKHRVDTHMPSSLGGKGIQRNSGWVFNLGRAPSRLITKIRLWRLEGFVTLPVRRETKLQLTISKAFFWVDCNHSFLFKLTVRGHSAQPLTIRF